MIFVNKETMEKTVDKTKIKNLTGFCKCCLIDEILCYKKLNNLVNKLDTMSCTKIVFFIKI